MLCAESVAAALTAALKTVGKSPRGPPPPARRPLPLAHAAFARGGPGLYERRRAAVGRRRRRRRERRRVVPAPRRVRVEHAVMVVPRCVQLSFKQMRAWSASGARRAKCRGTRRIVSTSTAVGTGRFVRRARAYAMHSDGNAVELELELGPRVAQPLEQGGVMVDRAEPFQTRCARRSIASSSTMSTSRRAAPHSSERHQQ